MNKKIWLPLFVIAVVLFGACNTNINLNIDRGSGNVTTQTRSVSGFDKVVISGIGDITVVQGSSESLEIEAEDNVIPHIKTEVQGSTLEIGYDQKSIIPTKTVKFKVTMRNIRGLDTKGVSNIHAEKISTDRLEIGISGTGNINLRGLKADAMTVNVSGAGNLNSEGEVSQQKITLSGAGNYNGEDLQSKSADVTITGLGKVTIWATDSLNVVISGTGGVDYYGSPQVSQQISGLGRLNSLGSK